MNEPSKITTFPVVGIGASAGGLEALNALVGAIPADSGIAYVIIQHLSPDHPSLMDQLLSSHACIPVRRIEDGDRVTRDMIHVLPEGAAVTLDGDTLRLHERKAQHALRTPIDRFFQSLAEARGRWAFGVVLSGTGSDGTVGVRAIKAAGGFALVQESGSARFPGMPDSAAATGLVDFALKPDRIPGRLLDLVAHRAALIEDRAPQDLQQEIREALPQIAAIIDEADGHDFSQYKEGTLVRRVERRMTVVRERSVGAFLERLRRDADERMLLLQDFLIGVTQFFRDEGAFETLRREAILPLLDRDQSAFRVWVPGCATGEEAYSIAILFADAMAAADDDRQVQIFGTDIDGPALGHARAGYFSESQLEALSEEHRRTYFVRADTHYQVNPYLRERCIFAPHNLLQDPPFSRLDLISCRNLLIYLTAKVQRAIIPRFHYGLNPGGYLFLGPSETLGQQERFFHTVDREVRLFRRNDEVETAFSPLGDGVKDTLRRDRRISAPRGGGAGISAPSEPNFDHQVLSFFARQSAPPFATVNASDEVTFLSERMGRYVRPAQGQPSSALDQFLLRDLRIPVRALLSEVRESGLAATTRNVVVTEADDAHVVDIDAVPTPFSEGSVLITLQPVRIQDAEDIAGTAEARDEAQRDLMEREITATRRQLASTQANFEATEQELRSSNEELLSMNEELQSANEELETSREELQSINEELETVNAELTENNHQLLRANSDLRNLFDSTDIATVFLDQALCVRRYTPASRRLFGIRDRDIGRPISDLKWRIDYEDLEPDAARVMQTLEPMEREVRIEVSDETFQMRLRPYRRTDDRIDGCVLTFFDITERKRTERMLEDNARVLAQQYGELETLYETTPVGLNLLDRDLRYLRINERLAEINGYPAADHIGRLQEEMLPEIDAKVREVQLQVLRTGQPSLGNEVHGTTPAQPEIERDWVVDYFPVRNRDGEIFAVGSCVTEVTEQKRMQREIVQAAERLADSQKTLSLFVEFAPAAIAMFDTEMTYLAASRRYLQDFGLQTDRPLTGMKHPDVAGDLPRHWIDTHRRVLAGETLGKTEEAVPREDGSVMWINWRMTPWRKADGGIGGALLFSEVKTAEVEARRAIEESEARLGFALETSRLGAWELDLRTGRAKRTSLHDRIFGHDDLLAEWTFEIFLGYVLEEDRDEVRRRFETAVAAGEIWQFQCRIRRADGKIRWIEGHGRPRTNEDGRTVALMGTVRDITEEKEAADRQTVLQRELAESEARLSFALETSRIGAWDVDLETGEVERTQQLDLIFGNTEPPDDWHAESVTDYVVEQDRARTRAAYETAIAAGERLELQYRIRRPDGAVRWVEVHGRPVLYGIAERPHFAGTIQDITARKEAEAQQSLLLHELQHRVKNTMATTLAIVKFSAQRATDIPSFIQTLRNRLEAITRTHDMLTSTEWRGAALRDVLEPEVGPYVDPASDRLRVTGDNPLLSAKQVLSLTLAFHELTTNAAKYGALSVDDGRLHVETTVSGGTITVVWTETGGPPVAAPQKGATGFGSFLLGQVLGLDLEGSASLAYHPEGVVWRIAFPSAGLD